MANIILPSFIARDGMTHDPQDSSMLPRTKQVENMITEMCRTSPTHLSRIEAGNGNHFDQELNFDCFL
jgi:hypothetical protein